MQARILIVDGEPGIRMAFGFALRSEGHDVAEAHCCDSALAVLERGSIDLVLTDVLLEGRNGIALLEAVRERHPLLPVVMITGQPSVDTAAQAVRLGAFDYVFKPIEREELLQVVLRALEYGRLLQRQVRLERQLMEREENISALLNAITETAVLVDDQGRILAGNRTMAERFNLRLEDLPGKNLNNLILDKELLSRRAAWFAQALSTGLPVEFEDERDGRVYATHVYPAPSRQGASRLLAVFSKDVTEARRTEQERNEAMRGRAMARRGLEAVFRSIPEAIFTVDGALAVMQANEAGCELLMEAGGDCRGPGSSLENVASPLACVCRDLLRHTLRSGNPVREHRVELPGPGNVVRVALVNTSPLLDEAGRSMGAVASVSDISRLARLERRLSERQGLAGLMGASAAMQRVYERIEQLAPVDSTVLFLGERGTGRAVAGEALHQRSLRSARPLIRVDCAAAPEALEERLFGCGECPGNLATAQGGTLFLANIESMPLTVQKRMLDMMENIERGGGGEGKPRQPDVRLAVSVGADIEERIRRQEFLDDFYLRISVMRVSMPPLRDRLEDVPRLAAHFMRRYADGFGKPLQGVSGRAIDIMQDYAWPGNVRELKEVVERACTYCPGGMILPQHLGDTLYSARKDGGRPNGSASRDRQALLDALEQAHWNKAHTARLLGISRSTLYSRLRHHGLAE